jgi:phage repressor protein C with HTH and peptisase S24 domain
MLNYNNFAQRILTVRNYAKFSQDTFAKRIGVSQGHLARVETGTNNFSRKVINRIANEFGVSVAWLETGEGKAPFVQRKESEEGEERYVDVRRSEEMDYFLIPPYPQRSGESKLIEKDLYVKIMPLKSWVENTLHLDPDNLSLLRVEGESMSPTLNPGDMLIVDQGRGKDSLDEGIYLITLSGTGPLLKRLQPLPAGKIRIISDNPRYESVTVSLEESAEITILGRIIWQARRV